MCEKDHNGCWCAVQYPCAEWLHVACMTPTEAHTVVHYIACAHKRALHIKPRHVSNKHKKCTGMPNSLPRGCLWELLHVRCTLHHAFGISQLVEWVCRATARNRHL